MVKEYMDNEQIKGTSEKETYRTWQLGMEDGRAMGTFRFNLTNLMDSRSIYC